MCKYKHYTNEALIKKYVDLSNELREVKDELKKRIEKNGKVVTPIGTATFVETHTYQWDIPNVINWLKRHSIEWYKYISVDGRKIKIFLEDLKKKNFVKEETKIKKQVVIKEAK